jgi:hypothetical protein
MKKRARRWVSGFSIISTILLALPARGSDDQITLYTPAFEGPAALGTSVATILNLQIWQTLRNAPSPNPNHLSFGTGVVVWGRPLPHYSHEEAEARAKEISLLAQFVLWGKVYPYGKDAIAQANLSIPYYHDFRSAHPERWSIEIRNHTEIIRFIADMPQRRYSFEPIVLTNDIIGSYSHPNALQIYSSPTGEKVIGAIGAEFKALEQREGVVKVRSGNKEGWVRLPELSAKRNEVVDFVGGILRVFRADWAGAESLMNRVIDNERAPNELRTDALLYRGLAAAQQDLPSERAFLEAIMLSPYAKRCFVYAVMGKLSDYRLAQLQGASADKCRALLQDARLLLREHLYLFEPNDQWVLEVSRGLTKLGMPVTEAKR